MLIADFVISVAMVGVFAWVYRAAQSGTLPFQNSIGIKTRWVMSSEVMWTRIHQKYAWIFLVDAIAFAVLGLTIIIGGFLNGSINETNASAGIVAIVTVAVMLVVTVIGVAIANQDAKHQMSR